ncbi:polyhydroxyalkanoate depolymerase [Sphingobium sp. 3R8]|uniref:Poly(3-hydroxybutyrate) depolymerase n=1 Tax=Sphingomonas bisphenolicum TaxID=296544 RepID=A0ABM7G4W4_9SPHN|nr:MULTISPECIES: polyhydroxyalkanoate depolymerase [Sphingomonadaceae]MBA4089385.1 polyhydroxyalkanoate depolymerase [Sphingobium sp.]MBZ9650237.1 polyhydroxyalkanoate depolymerase [Sphingobium sp. 3R8]BBF69618.1 poly(3-hydroxybutyrate) depolymerase [Sphingomonas bisphenolicum]
MRMLYSGYQAWNDMLAPARFGAQIALGMRDKMGPVADWAMPRRMFAMMDVFQGAKLTHKRPAYAIDTVTSGNAEVSVREEIALDLPFGDLLHFVKDEVEAAQPRVLVVAPMSGHFSTLLRSTVATLLRDHDVYITDWKNARDVPLEAGRFGFDDYVDYVIRFLQELGEGAHLVSVCQPCVPALAAVALMSEDKDKATPRSMTLMGGPIDPNAAPTVVNDLANEKPIEWFEENLISVVPFRYAGRGREVYPGFLQLSAFVSMNMERHSATHRELYQLLADGKDVEADRIKTFYEEYFAVLDMTKEFYLETVDMVFQRTLLSKGELTVRGRKVDPGAIRNTALLTVEGEKDDVCAVGQTSAAHGLCTGLRPHLKRHHLQPGVGHYGVFSGSKWEKQVYPQVRNMILAMN